MLNQARFAFFLIFLISFSLSACASPSEITEILSTATKSETSSSVPQRTPIVLSTATPESATPPPLVATPILMLSKSDAYERMANLLQDNAGCQLPCWWGLIPGKSPPQDMQSKLIPFNSIATANFLGPTSGAIYLTYQKNDLDIDINLSYRPNAEQTIIEMIKISTQALRNVGNKTWVEFYGTSEYDELLGVYSIQDILSKYGIPTQILVRADIVEINYTPSPADDVSPETFEITLLYPNQGIFVRYNARGERVGDNIRGCPTEAFVELWLLSPDSNMVYQDILSSNDETWEGNWTYSKSLEEATQLTQEKFYQAFRNSTDSCVETPLNIWPGRQ